MNKFSHIILVALLCCAIGCTDRNSLLPEADSFVELPELEASHFVKIVTAKGQKLETLKGSADVTVSKSLVKRSYVQTVAFRAPGNARLESFVPGINQLVSLVIIDDNQIYVRDNQNNKVFYAEPSATNIANVTNLPLQPQELALWLSGNGIVDSREGSVHSVAKAGAVTRLIFERGDERFEEYFEACGRAFRLVALKLFTDKERTQIFAGDLNYGPSSDLSYRASASGSGDICAVPSSLTIELPDKGLRGNITMRKLSMNTELKDELFEIPN